MTNTLLSQVKKAVKDKVVIDQTEDTGGTYERVTPPEGVTTARFISYVELGMRDGGSYQGKAKPNCRKVRLSFELTGKKHTREIEVDGEKKNIRNVISFTMPIKSGDLAGFTKLMKKMTAGRDITHMAEMLGEGFIVTVTHRKSEKDGKKVVYANLKDDSGYNIGAPSVTTPGEDGEMETKNVKVPEPLNDLQLLLWDSPTKEQWDSIFIDGTRTIKQDGADVEVSRNWMQEMVLEALDIQESALYTMLGASTLSLDGGKAESEGDDAEVDLDATSDLPETSDGDPLAGLDLDGEIPF